MSAQSVVAFDVRAGVCPALVESRCIWLTGLPGAGKSTLARLLEDRLRAAARHVCVLDGDELRRGLNRDLGFSESDRAESVRRAAALARLKFDAGLVVIVAMISPHRGARAHARSLFPSGAFVEVFVDTPLEECERRDPKGLYACARSGLLADLTGIDSLYEPPEAPELVVRTVETPPQSAVEALARLVSA